MNLNYSNIGTYLENMNNPFVVIAKGTLSNITKGIDVVLRSLVINIIIAANLIIASSFFLKKLSIYIIAIAIFTLITIITTLVSINNIDINNIEMYLYHAPEDVYIDKNNEKLLTIIRKLENIHGKLKSIETYLISFRLFYLFILIFEIFKVFQK